MIKLDKVTFVLTLVAAWLVGIITVMGIQKFYAYSVKKDADERAAMEAEIRAELEEEYSKDEGETVAPTEEPIITQQETESEESEPEEQAQEPIVYENIEYNWISDYGEIDSSYSNAELYRIAETIDPAVTIDCTDRAKYFMNNAHVGRVLKDLIQRYVADSGIVADRVNIYGDTRVADRDYYIFHVCFNDDAWQKEFYRFEIYTEPFGYRILSPTGMNIAEGQSEYQTEGFHYVNQPYDYPLMNYPLGIDASQAEEVYAWTPLTEYSKNQKPDRSDWIYSGASSTAVHWTTHENLCTPLFALESALQKVNWDSYVFDIRAQSVSMQSLVLIVYRDYNYWVFTCNADLTWDIVEYSYGQETRKINGQVSFN